MLQISGKRDLEIPFWVQSLVPQTIFRGAAEEKKVSSKFHQTLDNFSLLKSLRTNLQN